MEYKLHRVSRETVLDGKVLAFCRDRMILPDGKEELWDFVHHKHGGGACVVPVLPDGRILLVRQLRPAIDRECLELPAGAREDPGEDGAETARRELEEETGYRAGRLTKLLHLQTAEAWCDETTEVYLAEDLTRIGGQDLDEAEEISLEARTPEELRTLVLSGEIRDAKTAAGILAYLAYRQD
jgi:ADP-ribose pyrophosphatase